MTESEAPATYANIKTHFPAARIKKLMQTDEDIGKVAQATPVAVGRALELFLCSLVEKSVETATNDQSKKITIQILNKTIQENEQFDFVVGVCDKYLNKNSNASSTSSSASAQQE
ncbi:hypothetical protein KL921_002098 [Ogataea angusta]|uniref:Transcription factor CBF/NF-Y/archaeal histone domain-containing protein n=1 Tax=Pichia angusta TaxID=870730 RepID=A0AAN6I678_PICAN|nr:uncharacterized protein KL928_002280 [Ogataea angusta]KAG7811832.1 hypothetical protein KL921_002098 [Ogataea angusta]KAG7819606.1 hypothetical protein KL928_002280 [Ogataea angusta]KAG7824387.1 hypothetical protein KL909_002385 [Ogataea angusta]KAG7830822.1 hypothetical protein KL920_001413 [Ogataea angusta]KAG7835041.1 hypothetical protein KL943_002356 [Ogataea angusta]